MVVPRTQNFNGQKPFSSIRRFESKAKLIQVDRMKVKWNWSVQKETDQ